MAVDDMSFHAVGVKFLQYLIEDCLLLDQLIIIILCLLFQDRIIHKIALEGGHLIFPIHR